MLNNSVWCESVDSFILWCLIKHSDNFIFTLPTVQNFIPWQHMYSTQTIVSNSIHNFISNINFLFNDINFTLTFLNLLITCNHFDLSYLLHKHPPQREL
jgi:hypothetical protein